MKGCEYVSFDDARQGRTNLHGRYLETIFVKKGLALTWAELVRSAHGQAVYDDDLMSAIPLGGKARLSGVERTCIGKRASAPGQAATLDCIYTNALGELKEFALERRHLSALVPTAKTEKEEGR